MEAVQYSPVLGGGGCGLGGRDSPGEDAEDVSVDDEAGSTAEGGALADEDAVMGMACGQGHGMASGLSGKGAAIESAIL